MYLTIIQVLGGITVFLLKLFELNLEEFYSMPFTVEDGGRLNNFANEPRMVVEAPQKRNYVTLGILAFVLVGGLIAVAFVIS